MSEKIVRPLWPGGEMNEERATAFIDGYLREVQDLDAEKMSELRRIQKELVEETITPKEAARRAQELMGVPQR